MPAITKEQGSYFNKLTRGFPILATLKSILARKLNECVYLEPFRNTFSSASFVGDCCWCYKECSGCKYGEEPLSRLGRDRSGGAN